MLLAFTGWWLVHRRLDQRGIDQGAVLQHQPLLLELPIDFIQDSLLQTAGRQRTAKTADGRMVRYPFMPAQSGKPAKAQSIPQRLFQPRVRIVRTTAAKA